MTVKEFQDTFDALLKEGNKEKVSDYLTDLLARMENDRSHCSACGYAEGIYEPKLMLTVLNESATFYRDTGDYDLSVMLYQKLILELALNGMENNVNTASAKINRAAAYVAMGDAATAKEDLKAARELLLNCLCQEPDLLIGLGKNLASVYAQQGALSFRDGDFAQSAEMFAEAAEILKQYTGESREYTICRENEKKARAAQG